MSKSYEELKAEILQRMGKAAVDHMEGMIWGEIPDGLSQWVETPNGLRCRTHGKPRELQDGGFPHLYDCEDCWEESHSRPAVPLDLFDDFKKVSPPSFLEDTK